MSQDAKFFNDQSFHYVLSENLQVGPLVYPNKDGSNGQVIGTNGKGKLSFISSAGGGTVVGPGTSVDNSVALFSGTTGQLLKTSLGIINTAGRLSIPSLLAAGLSYPTTDGTNGQVLSTNGAGILSWITVSGGGGTGNVVGPGSSTNNAIATY